MRQICLTDEEIARIRQAMWTAHFYSPEHRRAYEMFNDRVEQGAEYPEKPSIESDLQIDVDHDPMNCEQPECSWCNS